jgi:hypothetical protein
MLLKSGSLNLLEPSGPVKACNGIALPLPFTDNYQEIKNLSTVTVRVGQKFYL